jgi:hypothetical protein
VLAAPPEAPGERLLEELRDELLMHGAALDALRDGALIAVIAGTEAVDAAQRAARAALVLRARLRGEIVLAAAGSPRAMDPVGEALDRGARVLSTGALHAVFAGLSDDAAPAGVRVDSRTAKLLGPGFRIERRDGGAWLMSEG